MSNEQYDPTAPEGDVRGRSEYITIRDVKIVAIVLVVLGIGSYPLYRYEVRQSEKSRCTLNMKAIAEAINMYAEQKDDRFPPVYRTGEQNLPGLGETGLPYTWCDDIQPLMSKRASFVCPSADPSEIVTSESPTSMSATVKTSYGLYLPYGGFPRSLVANPDQSGVVAETSNLGSVTSFDPVKMVDSKGVTLPDGFVIGWSDSNIEPDSKTTSVTRLAYPESDKGVFDKHGQSRHDGGIHILMASGEVRTLPPSAAEFRQRSGSFTGLWSPPLVKAAH